MFEHSQYSCILTLQMLILQKNKCNFIRFFIFSFYTFLFNLGKHVNQNRKISFSLLYLKLVTSCIIVLFLCCHLLSLIIYLTVNSKGNLHAKPCNHKFMTQKFPSLVQSVEKLQKEVQDVQSDKYKWISSFLLGSNSH